MARTDWKALQAQFEYDNAKYGTSVKDWCEAKGLNYQSARRYIKVRKTAQSDNAQSAQKGNAQNKSAQKGNAQNKSAQTAQNKKSANNKKTGKKKTKQDSSKQSDSTSSNSEKCNLDERDSKGRFQPGHSLSVGNSGNPEPSCSFEPGHTLSRKGGIYARYFPEQKQHMFDLSEVATLEDELTLSRARLQSGIEYMGKITEDLQNASSVEERISLYESYTKTQNGLDTLTARIESITKTLSGLGVDVVNKEKIIADTARIKNASRKLALEADKLSKEGKADDTPMSNIVSEIHSMKKSDLMS